MTPLKQHIETNHGSVYRAAKDLNKPETQLRRWISKGALVDDEGRVWILARGGDLTGTTTTSE